MKRSALGGEAGVVVSTGPAGAGVGRLGGKGESDQFTGGPEPGGQLRHELGEGVTILRLEPLEVDADAVVIRELLEDSLHGSGPRGIGREQGVGDIWSDARCHGKDRLGAEAANQGKHVWVGLDLQRAIFLETGPVERNVVQLAGPLLEGRQGGLLRDVVGPADRRLGAGRAV